jgi:hypothetical protein
MYHRRYPEEIQRQAEANARLTPEVIEGEFPARLLRTRGIDEYHAILLVDLDRAPGLETVGVTGVTGSPWTR